MQRLKQIFQNLSRSPFFLPIAAFLATAIAAFALLSGGIILINNQQSIASTSQTHTIQFTNKDSQNTQLDVEVADTPQAWEQGLMSRTSMPANHGMLFVFDVVAQRTFWMKNTLISLDIIFLDDTMHVVSLYNSTKPNQTSELYPSQMPIKYALETNGGWAAAVGLQKGDQLILK